MPMTLNRKTDAATEPVTAAEAKLFARIETSVDDDIITGLIKTARYLCEDICRRSFVNTTWTYFLDRFPNGLELWLPRAKLSSVTHIKYYDGDGNLQTLSSSLYHVDAASEPARIVLKTSESWPTLELDRPNAVEIEFVAGYGATAASVPEGIKTAMKQLISHWYNAREAVVLQYSVAMEVPMGVQNILWPYRVMRFFS